ncbi:MAG TPA: uracil-DNA glycosylase family protein, partial [Clostridia bacterium]|nr:uracil-DNA glycosylase family protein [Clostridia bacterium]
MEKTAADSLKKLYERYANEVTSVDHEYDFQFVFSDGLMKKNIMLIGEAPGKDEVEQKKPFVGMAGGKLKQFMDSLSLERQDIFITNAIKYRLY